MRGLPLSFEANHGQVVPKVKFLAHGIGFDVLLTPAEAVLLMGSSVVRMKGAGCKAATRIEGVEPLAGRSNYLIGSDPKQWRTNIPTYARVQYSNFCPG